MYFANTIKIKIMIHILNPNNVKGVTITPRRKSNYQWREAKESYYFGIRHPFFLDTKCSEEMGWWEGEGWFARKLSFSELSHEKYSIEDGVLYLRDCVNIHVDSNQVVRVWFDSLEDAKDYVEHNLPECTLKIIKED